MPPSSWMDSFAVSLCGFLAAKIFELYTYYYIVYLAANFQNK